MGINENGQTLTFVFPGLNSARVKPLLYKSDLLAIWKFCNSPSSPHKLSGAKEGVKVNGG